MGLWWGGVGFGGCITMCVRCVWGWVARTTLYYWGYVVCRVSYVVVRVWGTTWYAVDDGDTLCVFGQ